VAETGKRLSCPACGDTAKQVSLGKLWDRPQIIYHCRACDIRYLVDEKPPVGTYLTLMPEEDLEWREMLDELDGAGPSDE
jgi:hypothetical protein